MTTTPLKKPTNENRKYTVAKGSAILLIKCSCLFYDLDNNSIGDTVWSRIDIMLAVRGERMQNPNRIEKNPLN